MPPSSRSLPDSAEESVVAGKAKQHVVAIEATQVVVERVADDKVAEGVADADHGPPNQRQVLDIRPRGDVERGADRADDGVDTGAGGLEDEVGAIVHDIDVVAEPALHVVDADAAVEPVIAVPAQESVSAAKTEQRVVSVETAQRVVESIAVQGVAERVADADHGASGQRQVLDIRPGCGVQAVADQTDDGVETSAGIFEDEVAGVVDDVDVVAETTEHGIGANSAVE